MKNKKWLIPVCILLSLALLIGAGIAYINARSLGLSVGRCIVSNGRYILVSGNSPIVMSNRTTDSELFGKLTSGDKILVIHGGVAESYPGQTGAYAVFKLSSGTLGDISDSLLEQLRELGWMIDEN